jgi:serine/threonine protein phosphatase PrpC
MSTRLYLAMDMDEPQTVPLAGGLACVFTTRRPGRETVNEDAAALIPGDAGSGVIAVADGLGGLPAGSRAAELALQQLAGNLAGQSGDARREAVLTGLEQANAAILANGQGSGTTIAVVSIDRQVIRCYHAGDASVLVCGQRGKLKYQSVSHSPVGYAEASGMMNENEAMFHAERHLVSNMVGMTDMRVEIGPPVRLAPRDTVIAGSDGLFDNLYAGEIIERVRTGPLAVAGARLLDAVRERMLHGDGPQPHKPDDLTFVLYRPSGGGTVSESAD